VIPTTQWADCQRDPIRSHTFHSHHPWQPPAEHSEVLPTAGPAAQGKTNPKAHTNGKATASQARIKIYGTTAITSENK